jgi:phosphate transport system permease protein
MTQEKFIIQKRIDTVGSNVTRLLAIALLILVIAIFCQLLWASLPSIQKFGWSFLISSKWNPVKENFGALGPIYGTLMSSLIALLIAVPISFGIAIFLIELAPWWLGQFLRILVELLAGIPSIIYGMWGLFALAPFLAERVQPWLINHLGQLKFIGLLFQGVPLGIGILTAGIVLSIMVIPFIASVMRDVFEIVPDILKESAYGLGATRWEVIWNVILPYSKKGIVGAVVLGLGRALGETMAVAFVIGNAHQFSLSLLMPGSSITSVLANEYTEATGTIYNASLSQLGLILFIITFLILIASKIMLRR